MGVFVLAVMTVIVGSFLALGHPVEALSLALLDSALPVALVVFVLLAADLLLPIPSSLVATAAGSALGPLWGTLVVAGGLTAGCMAGLVLARRMGSGLCRRWIGEAEFERVRGLHERYGPALLVICRPVPVLAETSVLVAGAAGTAPGPLLGVLFLANAGFGAVYASLGAFAVDGTSFLLAFAGSCVLPGLAWAAWRMAIRRNGTRAGVP